MNPKGMKPQYASRRLDIPSSQNELVSQTAFGISRASLAIST